MPSLLGDSLFVVGALGSSGAIDLPLAIGVLLCAPLPVTRSTTTLACQYPLE